MIFFHRWLEKPSKLQWVNFKFDNFSEYQNVISDSTPSRKRHYDALRTKIDMWLTAKLSDFRLLGNNKEVSFFWSRLAFTENNFVYLTTDNFFGLAVRKKQFLISRNTGFKVLYLVKNKIDKIFLRYKI